MLPGCSAVTPLPKSTVDLLIESAIAGATVADTVTGEGFAANAPVHMNARNAPIRTTPASARILVLLLITKPPGLGRVREG